MLLAGHWLPHCPEMAGIAQAYLPLVFIGSISSFLNVILLSPLSFVIFTSSLNQSVVPNGPVMCMWQALVNKLVGFRHTQ